MVYTSALQIDTVLANVNEYFGKQRTPVKAKTIASRVNITPKQARYVLRVYFQEYLISDKLSPKRYYLKT